MLTYRNKRRLLIFFSLVSLLVLSFFSVLAERRTQEITLAAQVADYSRDGKVIINYQASPENKYIATNCFEAEGLNRVRGNKGSFVIDVKDYQPGTHTITLYSVASKGPDYQPRQARRKESGSPLRSEKRNGMAPRILLLRSLKMER